MGWRNYITIRVFQGKFVKSSPLFPILFFSLGPALLAFLAGFGIAYQQDASHTADLGRLAWVHLAYAQELKDDMAVIDLSKNLEKLESVRAFQVTAHSKSIVQGGNVNYLPSSTPEGVAYLFPSDWTYHETSVKGTPAPFEFTVLFHYRPGPVLWGSIFFLVSFVSGCGLGLFSNRASIIPARAGPASSPEKASVPSTSAAAKPVSKPAGISLGKNEACLFVDKNYVIRQVSPQADIILRRKVEELQDSHLLDLAPDPGLIQAFENPEERVVPKPFPGCPDVAVRLKPDSEGCLLIVESMVHPKPF